MPVQPALEAQGSRNPWNSLSQASGPLQGPHRVRASQVPTRVAVAASGVALGGAALFSLSATAVADEADEHGLLAPSYTPSMYGYAS